MTMVQTTNAPTLKASSNLENVVLLNWSSRALRHWVVVRGAAGGILALEKSGPTDYRMWMMTIPWSSYAFFPPQQHMDDQDLLFRREKATFTMMLPMLLSRYSEQFVAVHDGVVVDSDPSRTALVRRFFERYGDTHVYIGYVGRKRPIAYQNQSFQTLGSVELSRPILGWTASTAGRCPVQLACSRSSGTWHSRHWRRPYPAAGGCRSRASPQSD